MLTGDQWRRDMGYDKPPRYEPPPSEPPPRISKAEAKRIFEHCAKYGTRGFTQLQILAAYEALRRNE